ncbi:Uncharacterized protein FKW44_015311, partial [Caligus rogercresseyi]
LNKRRLLDSKKDGGGALFTFVQPSVSQKLPYREQQYRLRRAVISWIRWKKEVRYFR